jgi:site-specific DNA-methyltransferase (adenine-specific)/adenine-specific DNA-methyltransferase
MPTLDWIGKDAVVNHHQDIPLHLLEEKQDLAIGTPDADNLLIEGDNLLALKALLPHYAGQVDCVYIDPPYNTGNEDWAYNDNVNSPEIREWLGETVGKETEDLSRHDKWLCMMTPRLMLLHELLAEDGSFWMSIDDNEVHHARALLDEVFGRRNFISQITWRSRVSPANDANFFSNDHEYILVYAKAKKKCTLGTLPRTEDQLKH